MRMRPRALSFSALASLVLVVALAAWRLAETAPERTSAAAESKSGRPDWSRASFTTATTTREGLAQTIALTSAELAESPTNSPVAIRLADALLRQARVLNHAALPLQAEAALNRVLDANPLDYKARRMRATVYLSQHRFQEALSEAARCRVIRRDDPSIDGIIGDASLELGDYETAFAAFNRMMAARPDATAYARASYARELQGDLASAITLMAMAESATSAHDPEAQAWHATQLGHLRMMAGDLASARHEFTRAESLFADYPMAQTGFARLDIANGDSAAALDRLAKRLHISPSAVDFVLTGDAYMQLGQVQQAQRSYALAEAIWTSDTPEPKALERFRATQHLPYRDPELGRYFAAHKATGKRPPGAR